MSPNMVEVVFSVLFSDTYFGLTEFEFEFWLTFKTYCEMKYVPMYLLTMISN